MHPAHVQSPRRHWRPVRVILHRVVWPGSIVTFSATVGLWRDEPMITIRWDGDPGNPNDVGMPQSSGHAVPFVLPWFLWPAVLEFEGITEENRQFTKHFLGLDEPEEQAA